MLDLKEKGGKNGQPVMKKLIFVAVAAMAIILSVMWGRRLTLRRSINPIDCSLVTSGLSEAVRMVRPKNVAGIIAVHDPEIDVHVSTPPLFRGELFESGEMQSVADRVVKFCPQLKDCVFVDVGANIGTWTIFFGSKGMETYSFEPFPKNFRLLCTGVELSRAYFNSFGTVHLHNNAVSSTTGEHVDFQNEESSSNQGHVQVQFGKGGVTTMMLDELTNTIAKRVALLKIDTEGFEGHVFNGAWRFIERHRPAVIAFEFDPSWIREKSPFEPADILRRLSNMGYMRDDNGLVPIEPFSMSQVRSEVFLAVRAQ